MTDLSLEKIREKIDVEDFDKMTGKETGRFIKGISTGALTADDVVRIIDSSSQFVNNFCQISKEFRVHLVQNAKTHRALIEAATQGVVAQCQALDSIASQCKSSKYKFKIAEIIQSISNDFYKTIREFNKPQINWSAVVGGTALGILIGMGLSNIRST